MDTRFLEALDLPNVEVRRHDILNEALESASYDLIHLRLVLVHLREGLAAALAHIVDALRPGGWFLAEENDGGISRVSYPPDEALDRVQAAMDRVGGQLNLDRQLGRKLPAYLEQAGLADVESDGRMSVLKQGSEGMRAMLLFHRFQRERAIATGMVGAAEYDSMLETYAAPGPRRMTTPLLVAAWGRKP